MDIIEELANYSSDPLGFVLFAFPWEERGELEDAHGPEPWQEDILSRLGERIIDVQEAVRLAVASGHGVGKSALVSWIILWSISTFEDTRGVVTANTETQLKTKTWVELAKWFRLFIGRDLFRMTATAIFSNDPQHERTWRFDMVPWSERNTEAFAGLHNQGKRVVLVMDEASAIPDVIWETSEGALTDKNTQIIWAVFGNPTRNKGRFRECFEGGKFEHRWKFLRVDSREVSFTDKSQIDAWIQDYGEDSDFVRVRVKGVFPRIDADSFIPYSLAMDAVRRTVEPNDLEVIVLGVDVGRFGDDPSVIYPRKGRDARTLEPEVIYGANTMEVAAKAAAAYIRYKAQIVFVDGGGVGGGVVDRLRQLGIPVVDVDFGAGPDRFEIANDGTKYANKRAEIWGYMRNWLRMGCVPDRVHGVEASLVDELCAPGYGMNNREEIQLESKKDMRRRGIKSPNLGDALALTFSAPVYVPAPGQYASQPAYSSDYDPFAKERMTA